MKERKIIGQRDITKVDAKKFKKRKRVIFYKEKKDKDAECEEF